MHTETSFDIHTIDGDKWRFTARIRLALYSPREGEFLVIPMSDKTLLKVKVVRVVYRLDYSPLVVELMCEKVKRVHPSVKGE